jgi:hypothetical protein
MALQKLEELRLAKVWQQGRIKEYYTSLTDITREYFEGRYFFDAMEMTTDEILEALDRQNINKGAINKIKGAFELADLAKFAKALPTPLENDLCLNHCVDFVKETKPVPVAEIKNETEPKEAKETA